MSSSSSSSSSSSTSSSSSSSRISISSSRSGGMVCRSDRDISIRTRLVIRDTCVSVAECSRIGDRARVVEDIL